MRPRLFYKIFATYLLIVILSLGVMGYLVSREIKKDETKKIKGELFSHARVIALMPQKEINDEIPLLAKKTNTRITLINKSGVVVADSEADVRKMENHLNRIEVLEARIKGAGEATRYSHTLGVNMLYVALALREGPEVKGYLRLARPLYAVDASIDSLVRSIYHAALLVVLPVLLIAFLFSFRLMSPIREMASFTQRVRKGDVPGTLLIASGDEIGELARNINYMVMELHEKVLYAQEEKAQLEAAFAGMIEGLLIVDSRDRIERINDGMKRIIGRRYSGIEGKTLLEAFRNVELQDAWERFKKEGAPVLQEIAIGEDSPLILDVNISAVAGAEAEPRKAMLVFHDVTRLKKLETVRADFVANVTHEIKTPLTAIMGFADTLKDGAWEDKDTAQRFLEMISDNARRLDRLVDDLLTLSGIELGELRLQREDFPLTDSVESALSVIDVKAAEKGIALRRELAEALPNISGDRDRVLQVLLNILDNAVKFTAEGGKVTIGAAETDGYVRVRISDNGVGIPATDIPRLGERFYRVDKTRSRQLGGTGLGLSIVKHIVKALNGRIEIESRLGYGTSVSLYFPVAVGDTPDIQDQEA
ncbi:MAG: ATP-binding protein [Smithellaceae bacterium]|nr:ATP-binding protein [Smithellaceae bacterium]